MATRRIEYEWHNQPQSAFGVKFRSKQERRWATWLEILRHCDEIKSWEYEPKRFEFKERYRKKGVYTPDFRVVKTDGSVEWHEVKTALRPSDVYKFRQMSLDYPDVRLVLVVPRPARRQKQAALQAKARKYLADVIYAAGIFKSVGIS